MNIERWRLILGDASAGVWVIQRAMRLNATTRWSGCTAVTRLAARRAFALELPDCRGPTP